MSGIAPNDSESLEQNPLDSNQHGQTQNIIDETKDTIGRAVDANLGEVIDAANSKGTSHRVDDILNKPGSGIMGAQKKASAVHGKGFKVGKEADLHNLASSKQP